MILTRLESRTSRSPRRARCAGGDGISASAMEHRKKETKRDSCEQTIAIFADNLTQLAAGTPTGIFIFSGAGTVHKTRTRAVHRNSYSAIGYEIMGHSRRSLAEIPDALEAIDPKHASLT